MSDQADDQYFVKIPQSLAGRPAGGGAAEMARKARPASPLRTLGARILRQHTDERAWRRGAHGEMFVGWLLGRLPDGWYLFNDVPVGERSANIDHLVVGPGGVFTINTKNLTGKVWVGPRSLLVNGHRTDYLPKATAEARRASRLLAAVLGRPVEARGALAILADGFTIKEMPSDVYVAAPRGVKRWLLDQPTILRERDVLEIAGAAHKPETWTSTPSKMTSQDARSAQSEPMSLGQTCPCGGVAVDRTRRSDGVRFLGCSRFPKCRRTWPSRGA
jgi:hypothetical protein